MMRGLTSMRRWLMGLIWALAASTAMAQGLRSSAPTPGVRASAPVDGIAAIVNRSVITVREVDERANVLRLELKTQGINAPPGDKLRQDALETLITETLIRQEGEAMGIKVTPKDVGQAIESVAKRNNLTVAGLQRQVQAIGLSWPDYEAKIGRELTLELVRQRIAETSVRISDADVDAHLKEQAARKASGLEPVRAAPPPPPPPPPKPQPVQPLVMQLAQIFVTVPESATPEQVSEARKKIDAARARLRKGEKFEAVAAQVSEGPEASRGGDLGVRPAQGWPPLFLNTARNMQAGEVSAVIRSPAGFHVLKVVGRAGGQPAAPPPPPPPPPQQQTERSDGPTGPMMVEQTRARHILIKTTAVMSDEQAKQRLANARTRVVQGRESFAQVARAVSEDTTAPLGGDLGWINPGETVPDFERAMQALKPGEISEPVKSPFGWHLILVEERRTQDMADQYRRNMARQALFMRRAGTGFEAWVQQLRNQAFIDNRLFRPERQ